MAAHVRALFAELCALATAEARRAYYLEHPILTASWVIDEVNASMVGGNADAHSAGARQALEELSNFRKEISEGPRKYPFGHGPVEKLWKQVSRGEMREDRALSLAASRDVTDVLSEQYVHAVGWECARRASEEDLRKRAELLHRLLLAAARACSTPEARAIRIRAEREWLVTATEVLLHSADGRVYKDAVAGGEWLVKTLDPDRERGLLAESLYYLGVLHLDPYTAYRDLPNHERQHRVWLSNTAQELGPEVIDGIPDTRQALSLAEGYLRRARALANDDYAGLTSKALFQALNWRRGLGESVDSRQEDSLRDDALAAVDAMEEPWLWLRLAVAAEAAGKRVDEGKLQEILSIPFDEWQQRKGEQIAGEMLPALLSLLASRDPWRGLQLAEDASALVAQIAIEDQRMDCLSRELALFQSVAASANVDMKNRERSLEAIRAIEDQNTAAASLVALASDTPRTNDELVGIELVDEAEGLAADLASRHARAFSYLRALLWLGAASNAAKASPPRNAEAVEAYGNAIALVLAEHFPGLVLDMWGQIHNLTQRQDPDTISPTVNALLRLSLPSELVLGEPMGAWVRSICSQINVLLGTERRIAELPFLWQIAKGQRWAAILRHGTPSPLGNDPHAKRILERIQEARDKGPATELIEERVESDSVFFDGWLAGYVRAERFDGTRAWERIANLKINFDEHLAQLTSPDTIPQPLGIKDLQAALPPKGVLLMAFVGEHSDGRPASYAALLTREDIQAYAQIQQLEGTEFQLTFRERSAIGSTVGFEIAALRSTLKDELEAGQVLSPRAAKNLEGALPFLFGPLGKDLAALRAAGKDSLVIAPHDALHFAPFHLFTSNGVPLAEDWAVSYLPNLALLNRARRPRERGRGGLGAASVGLGFAGGAGGWTPIEEALTEATEVAKMMGVEPLLDPQATKATVIEALQRCAHVHIASHGALDIDAPAFHMIQLFPPDDEASRLCAHEILGLDLSGLELVTLSACETALGRVDRSDNLRGLSAALFTAGVSTIVGTLWPVETQASQTFFTSFYRELRPGQTRLGAFRIAQRDTRAAFPAYRDWGPFYLAGAWD